MNTPRDLTRSPESPERVDGAGSGGPCESVELACAQQALLAVLFVRPAEDATKTLADYAYGTRANGPFYRGLRAYQANGHALAQRALQAAYPVLAQLLGDESFANLSKAFWHAHPPIQGDLAQWGGALAPFIDASVQLTEEPYLGDVARLEWALHTCAACADAPADPQSFALLRDHDPAGLALRLAPGCAVLVSAWPVASILLAHPADVAVESPAQTTRPTLAAVGQMLRSGVAESAVVWRQGHQPRLRQGWPGEAALLAHLLAAQSLDDAVSSAPALDFSAWLPMAVQSGLLMGAKLLHPPLPESQP